LFDKLSPGLWITENRKFVQSVGIRLKRLLRFPRHTYEIVAVCVRGGGNFALANPVALPFSDYLPIR
jgi:hypothetical protein